jgi:hypothetical protein
MNQEDKIKEFKDHIVKNGLVWNGLDSKESNLDLIIREAIQFGSHLTAERAKEKVQSIKVMNLDLSPFDTIKEIVLQAIEESKIK